MSPSPPHLGLSSNGRKGRLAIFQNTSVFHSAPCHRRVFRGVGGGWDGGLLKGRSHEARLVLGLATKALAEVGSLGLGGSPVRYKWLVILFLCGFGSWFG